MLLHESRRAARTSPERNLILLEDQDRSLWNRPLIEEGIAFSATGIELASLRVLHAASSNCVGTFSSVKQRGGDGLVTNRFALRRFGPDRFFAGS